MNQKGATALPYYTQSLTPEIRLCDTDMMIVDTGFSARAKRLLILYGIDTLNKLLRLEEREVLVIEGLGRKTLLDIKASLLSSDYRWGTHLICAEENRK